MNALRICPEAARCQGAEHISLTAGVPGETVDPERPCRPCNAPGLAGAGEQQRPNKIGAAARSRELAVRTAAVSRVLIATTALFVFVMDRVAGLTRRLT